MKASALLAAVAILTGCSVLNEYVAGPAQKLGKAVDPVLSGVVEEGSLINQGVRVSDKVKAANAPPADSIEAERDRYLDRWKDKELARKDPEGYLLCQAKTSSDSFRACDPEVYKTLTGLGRLNGDEIR
ncbi:MAG: hypothetical protein MRJ68_18910 [Nitrospira sp.]|nr:hypothetical protein [Nitrospira sp.]